MPDPAPGPSDSPGLVPVRTALLSVSDKEGLVPFARTLHARGVTLVSTGGTRAALTEADLPTVGIETVTGFPEMMDGRVKTLHPKVHGGLLAVREDPAHAEALRAHGITPIDLVCVNLYPFEKTVAAEGVSRAEAVEQIDIGGPSMLRSAAKNHRYVAAVCDPGTYARVEADLAENDGSTSAALRSSLAADVFARTAAYDAAIAAYLLRSAG